MIITSLRFDYDITPCSFSIEDVYGFNDPFDEGSSNEEYIRMLKVWQESNRDAVVRELIEETLRSKYGDAVSGCGTAHLHILSGGYVLSFDHNQVITTYVEDSFAVVHTGDL